MNPHGPKPRPGILDIAPYIGGDSKLPGANRVIKLSSNEGAFGPPPGVHEALQRVAGREHRYPDGAAVELRRAIGARFRLDPAHIVCGSGSDELIYLLCLAYGGAGTELITSIHSFGIYAIAGRYAGCSIVTTQERDLTVDVDAMLAAVTPQTRLIFIANPNNPTGSMLPMAELQRLRAGLPPDVLLVLDGAYAEYIDRPDYDAGVSLVNAGDNTVMIRTFSKIFGLAGLRLGWAYAPAPVVAVLNRVRAPFNVNQAAQTAGFAALSEPGWIEKCRAHNTEYRAKLAHAAADLGIKVWPSEANFVLVDFGNTFRSEAANAFLRGRGVIARGVAGYELPHCLRITVGAPDEVDAVIEALEAFTGGPHDDA